MFGSISHLLPTTASSTPPKDVPPPTPVNFPQCFPQADDEAAGNGPREPLTKLLQSIIRPTEVGLTHFEALGVHVQRDAAPETLIPDPAFIPDFAKWDALSYDEARELNDQTRRPLSNGNRSPGVQTYHDRKRELSVENHLAYRSVRRLQPPPGQPQARLGNAYEFFRNLEALSTCWDDPTLPKPPPPPAEEKADNGDEPSGESSSSSSSNSTAVKNESNGTASPAKQDYYFFRTTAGSQMPPEYRLNVVMSFLKLVAYDFGCNVSAPRMEPRLYLNTAAAPSPAPTGSGKAPRSSYFASGCIFIFRTPLTREAARSGIVEGPLAAVSVRHTTTFPPPRSSDDGAVLADRDSSIDLARELVAALLTAQHRAREGREEKRFGEGAWWATKPRWGGGPGGPIGREVDAGLPNTDDTPDKAEGLATGAALPAPSSSSSSSSMRGPASKKLRKNLAIYDNYRMVRPPSSSWDKKTRYMAIGRDRAAAYDDVFVVSALFHHISIVRVRVPTRLLDVLDGAVPDDDGSGAPRSWGRLEVVRSRWYDFFQTEERVAAMQLVWGMMSYLMRKDEEDVKMEDAPAP